jgi:putative transposase
MPRSPKEFAWWALASGLDLGANMARERRLNIHGGTYHVMNRGNRKALIFEDDRDRRRFLRILAETLTEFHVTLLAGVLMGNHFHLVVLTPHGNLSEFMQQLEGQFAQYSNWRHSRVGHVFQGRFTAVLVENDIHLFIAAWYVFTNPVMAGWVRRPEDWKWSSYPATAGLAVVPGYLSIDWIETLFPAVSLTDSQQLFRHCMNDPQPVQAYIQAVEPTMEAAIRSYVAKRLHALAQPCSYRTLMRPPLELLFPENQDRADLIAAVAVAHETHGYKLAEIALGARLNYSTVSHFYRSIRKKRRANLGSDPKFEK